MSPVLRLIGVSVFQLILDVPELLKSCLQALHNLSLLDSGYEMFS
jgi:hypothetical protein